MTPVEYVALDLYIGAFSARQDAYVQNSRAHVNAPLTPEVANAAFRQGWSLSGYLAVPGPEMMMTHVGAIDFDTDDGFEQAKQVGAFLGSQHGIPSLLERSRRGAHLWVQTIGDGRHASQPFGLVPAKVVRRALQAAAMLTLGSLDHIEVFPKNSTKDWGVGALRLPLQRHPKTGVRYPVYGPSRDEEVPGIIALVNVMADIVSPYDALYGLAGQDPSPIPYPSRTGLERPFLTPTEDAPRITDLLARRYGLTVAPGHSVRCPFHDDQKASLSVSLDDERCWCKAPSCIAYNDGRGLGSIALMEHLREESPIAARHI